MAFPIPKIEYKNGTTTGATTSGSGTLSSVEDTSAIEAGMFIKGTGIPAGATVESVSGTEVILANGAVCTATAASIDLSFGFAIEFEYPPKEPNGEEYDTKATISDSLSGVRQTSISYIEGLRYLVFSFVSPSIFSSMQTWLTTDGLLGNTFRYFEDKTLTSYTEYELDSLKVTPKKIAPRSETTYSWEVPLRFRRVVA